MYSKIYVPVDNSDHSNRAIAHAVEVAKKFESTLVGCHVYAARMHDYRFKQMEYTLPDEYLDEVELERQRKIHDSLITLGLKLISESYLDQMQNLCRELDADICVGAAVIEAAIAAGDHDAPRGFVNHGPVAVRGREGLVDVWYLRTAEQQPA